MNLLFGLVGLGFAVAGGDKLAGDPRYRTLFRGHWGWADRDMRLVGAAELAGGLLLALPPTRRIGGALLAGTSAIVLSAEVKHSDTALALPRLGLMLAALLAVVRPSSR